MGRHGTTVDAHRKPYYSGTRASEHVQRKIEAGDVAKWFVLPPAETATNASKPRRKPHHNAALVRGLRDNELRACYRATFKEDPGQMGKDKMLEAFLKPKAPRACIPAHFAPEDAPRRS